MKPRFQLWDSDSANLVGLYESIPEILVDLEKTSSTIEEKAQIRDLVVTLSLGGPNDDSVTILDGETLYRLSVGRSSVGETESSHRSQYLRVDQTRPEVNPSVFTGHQELGHSFAGNRQTDCNQSAAEAWPHVRPRGYRPSAQNRFAKVA